MSQLSRVRDGGRLHPERRERWSADDEALGTAPSSSASAASSSVNMSTVSGPTSCVVLDQVHKQFSKKCVAVQSDAPRAPSSRASSISSTVRHVPCQRRATAARPIPEITAQAALHREQLVNTVVKTDEALHSRHYLEEGKVSARKELAGCTPGTQSRTTTPVACGSATKPRTTGLSTTRGGMPSPAKKPLDLGIRGEEPQPLSGRPSRAPSPGASTTPSGLAARPESLRLDHVKPRPTKGKEQFSQLLLLQGEGALARGRPSRPVTSAPWRRLEQVEITSETSWRFKERSSASEAPALDFPPAGDEL